MRVRLAVAELVNSVFINGHANMVAGDRRVNMGIIYTNRKLLSIHSESVPRSTSKANTYSYVEIPYSQPMPRMYQYLSVATRTQV